MTGFACAEGSQEGFSWAWELKSVNGKSLDLRLRLPPGFDHIEPQLRSSLATRLKRGNISATLSVVQAKPMGGGIRINREALDQILALVDELSGMTSAAAPRLDGILGLRGVLESTEDEPAESAELREQRSVTVLAAWEVALAQLVKAREAEGARLVTVLRERLDEISGLAEAAERCAATQPAALKERLRGLVAALLEASSALPEERLAQEAALLVARADVREELDRLRAHLAAADELLREGALIGRRFDFLCQEFNREANTLCSKSADVELTRIGLALKAAIEQLREQIQNIE
ncbi:MAG: YicC family protein [Alphaproteobacteria bacterium]|nr:YicC family protein [Alphaproteobacteria bacterium]